MTTRRFRLSQLSESIELPIDVFICCGSYEDRSRSVADAIEPGKVRSALIVEHTNLRAHVGENTRYLSNRFGSRAMHVPIDSTDPIVTADSLMESLQRVADGKPLNYLIDITTFTHESLLILFRILCDQHDVNDQVTFVYTSAADYSSGDPVDQKWLSKGVDQIRSVLGYPGELLPSRRSHLVILVGYEHERATTLIKVFEPSLISLGYGKSGSATSEKNRGAMSHFYKLVSQTAKTYGQVAHFEFSCNDPLDAKRAILERVSSQETCNQIVAPMNTKISTLGSALAALEDDRIQLCYAQALTYNYAAYSSPGDSCYLISLSDLLPAE